MSKGNDFSQLQAWFEQQLREQQIDWQSQPLRMDGQSDFDYQCLQLLKDAERHWRLKYGFAPSAQNLMQALFLAVSAQDQQRQQPSARQQLKQWLQWLTQS